MQTPGSNNSGTTYPRKWLPPQPKQPPSTDQYFVYDGGRSHKISLYADGVILYLSDPLAFIPTLIRCLRDGVKGMVGMVLTKLNLRLWYWGDCTLNEYTSLVVVLVVKRQHTG